jgi:hypothetical protein
MLINLTTILQVRYIKVMACQAFDLQMHIACLDASIHNHRIEAIMPCCTYVLTRKHCVKGIVILEHSYLLMMYRQLECY